MPLSPARVLGVRPRALQRAPIPCGPAWLTMTVSRLALRPTTARRRLAQPARRPSRLATPRSARPGQRQSPAPFARRGGTAKTVPKGPVTTSTGTSPSRTKRGRVLVCSGRCRAGVTAVGAGRVGREPSKPRARRIRASSVVSAPGGGGSGILEEGIYSRIIGQERGHSPPQRPSAWGCMVSTRPAYVTLLEFHLFGFLCCWNQHLPCHHSLVTSDHACNFRVT